VWELPAGTGSDSVRDLRIAAEVLPVY